MLKKVAVFSVLLASGAAMAALTDSLLARRATEASIVCPVGNLTGAALNTDLCSFDVLAIRPLSDVAVSEAKAAGIDPEPARETLSRRTITRAQLNTLIAASNPAK